MSNPDIIHCAVIPVPVDFERSDISSPHRVYFRYFAVVRIFSGVWRDVTRYQFWPRTERCFAFSFGLDSCIQSGVRRKETIAIVNVLGAFFATGRQNNWYWPQWTLPFPVQSLRRLLRSTWRLTVIGSREQTA